MSYHLPLFFALAFSFQSLTADEPTQKGDQAFCLTKVHQIHLEVTADNYKTLTPTSGGRAQFGFSGRTRPGLPAPGTPDAGVGKFNFQFKYVPANVRIGKQQLKKVGLRYKGNGTYLTAMRSSKKSFKLDFDRFETDLRFDGLKKLNLHCAVTDPTKIREILAYHVFRAAGVPASRTALAQISITVPGKFDKEHLGLYNVVEQVDKQFLKRHFGSSKGLLLKPEGVRGVPYLTDDLKNYEIAYNPKTTGDEKQWKRLIEFTRIINKADTATFQKEIANYLDLDNFVRFLAATSMVATLDSILGFGHNFYLYLSPKTNQFSFLPWDLDQSFGTFFPFGSVEQQVKLSIDHPHSGEVKLIERLLAMPKVKKAYHAQVRQLAKLFSSEKLANEIAALEKLTKDMIAKDQKAARDRREGGSRFGGFGGFGRRSSMALKDFVKKRAESALAQLSGSEKGFVPRSGFGGFGGGGRRPGFGGRRPGSGFNPFGRSGANAISKPLLQVLDANKDGKVSEEELTKGMKKLFREWDKNKDAKLDEREVQDGLQRLPRAPRRP